MLGLFLLHRWVIFVPLLLLSLSGFAHKHSENLPTHSHIEAAHAPNNIPLVSELCDTEYENDSESEIAITVCSPGFQNRGLYALKPQSVVISKTAGPAAQEIPLFILFHSWKGFV